MRLLFLLVSGMIAFSPGPAGAVSMTNDPKGFHNIVWGTALNSRPDLELTRQGRNIIEYQFKDTPPWFASIPVESLRLSTIDDQFARGTIRYRGAETHKKISSYLNWRSVRTNTLPGKL